MKPLIGLIAALAVVSIPHKADAWGAVHGAYGGAAYRGPAGGAAVRGPYGGAAVRGPAGGTAYRAPGYGGAYRPGYPVAGAAVAGAAVGAAVAAPRYPYPPPPYYYPPPYLGICGQARSGGANQIGARDDADQLPIAQHGHTVDAIAVHQMSHLTRQHGFGDGDDPDRHNAADFAVSRRRRHYRPYTQWSEVPIA